MGNEKSSKGKNKDLGSVIDGVGPEDWKTVPYGQKNKLKHLKELQNELAKHDDSKLYEEGVDKLNRIADVAGLSNSVIETATDVYTHFKKQKFTKAYSDDAVIAAVIYYSCRVNKQPCGLVEIAETLQLNKRTVGRAYNKLVMQLKLQPPQLLTPRDYVPRFCDELKLSDDVAKKSLEILADGRGIENGTPQSYAAAAIYLSALICGVKHMTQDKVAKVAGTSGPTIKKRYKRIYERQQIEISY